MTREEAALLPTTIDGHQVAELWGCSYWSVLDQVKAGTCPVAPLRLGRKLRWPTAMVLASVGIEGSGHPSLADDVVVPLTALRRGRS
ncbi:MAG: hypothetical protein M3450_08535 [Actinomycetota bacterium]|nr:hypothetical protein [Actinomycetota bacterium]